MQREWTNEELNNYLTFFSEVDRENVLKQVVEDELLGQFLSTTDGRLILGSVVDQITECTMRIVRLCNEGFTKNLEDIKQASLQINVARNFMRGLANIAMAGETHKENMQKVKATTDSR